MLKICDSIFFYFCDLMKLVEQWQGPKNLGVPLKDGTLLVPGSPLKLWSLHTQYKSSSSSAEQKLQAIVAHVAKEILWKRLLST